MRELATTDFEAIKTFLETSKDSLIANVIKRSKIILIKEESFLR